MPIYEYSCKKCGEVIERIQKFSDPPLRRHPGCGGALTKLISQSAFQLKGSGWYVTDYARSASGADKGSQGSEESTSPEKAASDKPGKKDKKEGPSASKDKSDSGK